MIFAFRAPLHPVAWSRAGAVIGGKQRRVTMFTPKTLRDYERDVHILARQAWGAQFGLGRMPLLADTPIAMTLRFDFPFLKSWTKRERAAAEAGTLPHLTKPDLLNLGKAIEDALQKVCYVDDKAIVRSTLSKGYAPEAGVTVRLEWTTQ